MATFGNLAFDDETGTGSRTATKLGRGTVTKVRTVSAGALSEIDLDKIVRQGDVYVAPLADGRQAVLTLDPALQELAERLLNESRAPRGGIVAMAPDGRILALAGRRTEEPTGSREGIFDWRLATEVWAPAASIFKLVTASALVRAGVDPLGKVCYHGGLRSVLEHNLQDDRRDSRCEHLSYGVAHSQNAILGKLAFQKLDPITLEAEAKAFGWLDRHPGPLAGLKGVMGELALPQAKDLEFARAAAGFKGAKLSVIGGAVLAATFAADGEQPVPRLIASIDGVATAPSPARRAITVEAARAVAQMMAGTCENGSAAKTFRGRAKAGRWRVAGKTGTLTRTDPFYMEHSWFVGFAPVEKPEIVVSVVLGNPESWHLRGHEAARRMIDRAFTPVAKERAKDRTVLITATGQNAD
ncbi:MAG: penicillin-binding protein [Deltaproteobacteria bacterium]|nr:penicillin-binding protein [Deltaproteobacteria bacterium]